MVLFLLPNLFPRGTLSKVLQLKIPAQLNAFYKRPETT
jgi:hypothetical protein